MAILSRRYPENVAGDFFVDDSCINCDTCRQLCPSVFRDQGGYSVVQKQPKGIEEIHRSRLAIIACPTGSIGSLENFDRKLTRNGFPMKIDDNVYYCGYNSPKSFGANSYLILHEDGNWLIDAPRYSKYLVEKIKQMGGLRYIFLTHSDDVADAEKYQGDFEGCERIIHFYERHSQPDAEVLLKGFDTVIYHPEFKIIPVPGHTKGHCVLLYKNKFLFTGDHLYWRRDLQRFRATRRYCWYNWDELVKSMRKLKNFEFEWVLPGHGQRIHFEKSRMKEELTWLITEINKHDYW